jgi:hypothetical protein
VRRVVVLGAAGLVLAVIVTGYSWASSRSQEQGTPDPNTSINVDGSIGGVQPRETRSRVEHLLGPGQLLSTTAGSYTVTRVSYPASDLLVTYVHSGSSPDQALGISTTSSRYHTADGLRLGSTLAKARAEAGLTCYYQPTEWDCEGGLGAEKPVTVFTVKAGRVVRVLVLAVAD